MDENKADEKEERALDRRVSWHVKKKLSFTIINYKAILKITKPNDISQETFEKFAEALEEWDKKKLTHF